MKKHESTNSQQSVAKISKVEVTKSHSKHLRGDIAEQLLNNNADFAGGDTDLLKFHGIYQQDDRDVREGKEKSYSLMVRGRIPGGKLTAKQYLIWDKVASQYSNDNSIRATTRQSLQLHGILKTDLKAAIADINKSMLSTQGACGDVVRNVTQVENPFADAKLAQLDYFVNLLSDHFLAKTNAYPEIWLDKKQVNIANEVEPFYGEQYLPRKFKIAMTVAGNNSVDVYTNDMAFAATFIKNSNNKSEIIAGFFVFAGGGMGMTHNKPETFPRLADLLGWIAKDDLIAVAEAIVSIHRDFGNRENRKNARLKYVVAEKGLAWFKKEITTRCAVKFVNKALPVWQTPNILGWHQYKHEGVDMHSYGLHLTAGRIIDTETVQLKTGLAKIIKKFNLDVQMCADQNILLKNIIDKPAVETKLAKYGIIHHAIPKVYQRALACVALPTCGLALNEAERALPDFLVNIQLVLEKYHLTDRAPVFRVTGCANGCARPHTAEMAFIGRTKISYSLYLGGSEEGDYLAQLALDKVDHNHLVLVIDTLFHYWQQHSAANERLGEFARRVGVIKINELLTARLHHERI